MAGAPRAVVATQCTLVGAGATCWPPCAPLNPALCTSVHSVPPPHHHYGKQRGLLFHGHSQSHMTTDRAADDYPTTWGGVLLCCLYTVAVTGRFLSDALLCPLLHALSVSCVTIAGIVSAHPAVFMVPLALLWKLFAATFTYALHRCGFPLLVVYSSPHPGQSARKHYLRGIIKAQTSLSVSARCPLYSMAFYSVGAAIRNAETYFMGATNHGSDQSTAQRPMDGGRSTVT